MELKGKHLYGFSALVVGIIALIFSLIYWFIYRDFNTTVKATLAGGLIGIALAAWLEIDLITSALRTRQARFGAETVALTLVFLVVVGLVNYIFYQDKFKTRWDLTEAKENTLTPETLKILSELKEPVKIIGFYTTQSQFSQESTEKTLRQFREKSNDKLSYQFVDPQANLPLAEQYGVTRDATLFVERGKQRESIDFADEQSITNALIRLNDPTTRVIYFVSGHGELSPDDTTEVGLSDIKLSLEGVNYKVRTIAAITDTIPADASAIVIAGPKSPYRSQEIDVISKYLASGGKAVVLFRPTVAMGIKKGEADLLADYFAKAWGVVAQNDMVLDPQQYVTQIGAHAPLTVSYSSFSPILRDLKGIASFYPVTRSFKVADGANMPAGISTDILVKTSPVAWGETDFDSISAGAPRPDVPADAAGELPLAVSAENNLNKGRIVVFGSGDFAINQFDRQTINGEVLINSVKWVTGNEKGINLTPKPQVQRVFNIYSIQDQAIVFVLSCLLPPFLVLLAGAAMWWSRRRGNA